MSNQQSNHESLVSSIEQLQQHEQVLAKYVKGMKRRLDDLTEQFNNRPELQQIINLQDALAQVHRQLNERSPPQIQPQPVQVQSYEHQSSSFLAGFKISDRPPRHPCDRLIRRLR